MANSTSDDIIVGVGMSISAILCIIPNVIVLRVGFFGAIQILHKTFVCQKASFMPNKI